MNTIANLSQSLSASQELSYKIFSNDELYDKDIHSVTLKWCSFSDIHFCNCELYDSDWEGCQLKKVTFRDIPMEKSDITSVIFEECTFINTVFQEASISDATFIHCHFENCDLNHIGMTDSSFHNCTFQQMEMLQSSSWLNLFKECTFIDFTLRGNFYYNFMIQNQYQNTKLDISLLSSNYGFLANELNMLGFHSEALQEECASYQDEKDFFALAIIRLNLKEQCYDYIISVAIQTILQQLKSNIVVRREQIEFIRRVWEELAGENQISLYTTLFNLLQIQQFLSTDTLTLAAQKAYPMIFSLYQTLIQNYQYLLKFIQENNSSNLENSPSYIVKITYYEEPKILITVLLEQLRREHQILCESPVRIKTMSGSFVEYLQMAQPILPYFSLLISVLGYIHNVHKDSKQRLETKSNNTYIYDNSITANFFVVKQSEDGTLMQTSGEELSPVVERQVLDIFQTISKHKILDDDKMYGYNSNNIKKVEITTDNSVLNN